MSKSSATRSGQPTEEVLLASRALLGVVARSLSEALEKVTLPQFRVLVLLAEVGPTRVGELAERLGVHPSTFSRTTDRLVRGGWVRRSDNPETRREVLIVLSTAGADLVAAVTERRRAELDRILKSLPAAEQRDIARALIRFAQAAGEPTAETLLTLGL